MIQRTRDFRLLSSFPTDNVSTPRTPFVQDFDDWSFQKDRFSKGLFHQQFHKVGPYQLPIHKAI